MDNFIRAWKRKNPKVEKPTKVLSLSQRRGTEGRTETVTLFKLASGQIHAKQS